jgi:hypothetical protein
MSKLMPGDNFEPYAASKAAGASIVEVAEQMRADGLSGIAQIRGLRSVFGLSLVEVKQELAGGKAEQQRLQENVAALVPRALK